MNQKSHKHDSPAEIADLLRRLPSAFPAALVMLMDWCCITKEALAEAALLSPKTVQRLRNDDSIEPSLETVFALCIGLQLPFQISFALIQRASFTFKPTLKHVIYQDLLVRAPIEGFSIYDANEYLTAHGLMAVGGE